MRNLSRVVSSALLLCVPFTCAEARADQAPPAEKRTFRAVRTERPPVIDGDLTDDAWASAPEITGFTQHDPDDGKPATQNTIVKMVYDDDAIYVAARMDDTRPVTTLLGRRDTNLESDWFRIYLDAQNDDLTGASFWVNPSNVQVDMILYNDIYDDWSWDAVWSSAAKIVPGGWIAEARIPYSQLRFSAKPVQTWGVNFFRRIATNKEVDRLINTPKGENGLVSRFADLTGIEGIKPERALELVPYGVARSDISTRFDRLNPFARSTAQRMDAGLDVKYGITPGLTLTGTINPDFGQVEVDPAVVNLTAFETVFPEKRPFFTEGTNLFRFGSGPAYFRASFNVNMPNWFYSRRIGRSPQGVGTLQSREDYVDAPGETTILGAAKLTGKFGDGWSVGVIDALTDKETADHVTLFEREDGTTERRFGRELVEPRTNYFVSRLTKEYGENSRIGFLFTSVNRDVPGELSYLRSGGYVAGVDGYTFFGKKDWLLEWLAGGSRVTGTASAIETTQKSSARYYNRPDAEHIELDPKRTSLDGFGGRVMLGKQTGKWRPNLQIHTYSPGLEMNDVGFMPRTDVTATHALVNYVNEDVGRVREKNWWFGKYQNWNYAGDLIANGGYGNWFVELKNYWYVFGSAGFDLKRWDDRKTRGGPLVERAASRSWGVGAGSDSRKKLSFESSLDFFDSQDGSYSRSMFVAANYRPSPSIRLSLTPSFRRAHEFAQYVTTATDATATATYGKRYIFAELEQRTIDIGTRVEWTVSSRLSFQLYMQPFIATGGYHDYKQLARPRSRDYDALATELSPASNTRKLDASTISFTNPDFNLRSVRGSAVVRWEFRPGSALYVVWNENREQVETFGDFRFGRDFAAIPNAPSEDVFLVKVSYWLPM